MKYPVYITLKDFLRNGGVLSEPRTIYNYRSSILGTYLFTSEQGVIHVFRSDSVQTIGTEDGYVKCESNPIFE